MKTRFTSLVTLKKSTMEKSEQALQNSNMDLQNAQRALEESYNSLNDLESPTSGNITDYLASKMLFDSQRNTIQHNKEWIDFAKNQVEQAKGQLKLDMIEHEKFKYLELEEIKKILKQQAIQDAKDLDEIALITHTRNNKQEVL